MKHFLRILPMLLPFVTLSLAGQTPPNMGVKIDAKTRERVINEAVAKLNEFYVFPDTAQKISEAVQSRLKTGAYDTITDGERFAVQLTDDLRAVSHDKHLRVSFSVPVLPRTDPDANRTPSPAAVAQRRAQLERSNCFFEKPELLPSNIGYLKFNAFAGPEICAPTATAAMGALAHVDALILDLRDNRGGSPDMIAYISSYLFAERTRLSDLYNRKEDKTTEFWTGDVPGLRIVGKPVFVLTSAATFSAGEAFAYDLQSLKRATIIGETTGGGAHPVTSHRIDDHFTIGVPFARAINPITRTNWEGTGVEPDVKTPAGQAFETAKRMATEEIRRK